MIIIESILWFMESRTGNEKENIAALIERLARLMRTDEFAAGLNPAQWEALRYLSRCNRFSNSPGALAAYLGATKGTVSQSVQALARKGLVDKNPRPGESRSVALTLTKKGHAMLARDPRRGDGSIADVMGEDEREALGRGLRKLLLGLVARNGLKTFGLCRTCRHFKPGGITGGVAGTHFCGLLKVPLKEADIDRVCVEHESAAA